MYDFNDFYQIYRVVTPLTRFSTGNEYYLENEYPAKYTQGYLSVTKLYGCLLADASLREVHQAVLASELEGRS